MHAYIHTYIHTYLRTYVCISIHACNTACHQVGMLTDSKANKLDMSEVRKMADSAVTTCDKNSAEMDKVCARLLAFVFVCVFVCVCVCVCVFRCACIFMYMCIVHYMCLLVLKESTEYIQDSLCMYSRMGVCVCFLTSARCGHTTNIGDKQRSMCWHVRPALVDVFLYVLHSFPEDVLVCVCIQSGNSDTMFQEAATMVVLLPRAHCMLCLTWFTRQLC